MRGDKRTSLKSETKGTVRGHKRGVVGYSRKTALLEEAITQMNAGKYGRSASALKELLALDPQNMEARRLFATLHLRLGSLIPARQAFDSLITEALQRQDYWLAESLLREYLAAGPRCVPFLEKLGVIYEEKGDVQEAVAEYGKAIDILIEDPDPDHPHLVSQLYKKVRDLAPASPIAIQLASFFDTQTGDLIARATTPSEPVPEPLVTTTDHQAIPELASGVMPWDIETPQGEPHASGETTAQPDGASSVSPTQDREPLSEAVTAGGQGEQPNHVPIQVQPDRSLDEQVPAKSPELTYQDGDRRELSVQQEDAAVVNAVGSQEVPAGVLSSDLAAEAQAPLLEPGVTGVEDCPTFAEGVVEPIQQPAEIGRVSTRESSAVQPATNDQSAAGSGLTALTQETESAASPQSQVTSIPLPEAVSAIPDDAVGAHTETVRDIPASGGSGRVSPQSPAEPWTEPGFSWETLFDRAWSFGTLPSASSPAERDTIQAKSEVPSISERTHPDHSPIESESAQIPDRVESAAFIEEATSTGSIKPMPWDQIQESVLPIPPAQVEEVATEGTATTEAHSVSIGEDKPQIESVAVENSGRTDRDAIAEELTGTSRISSIPCDGVQESVIHIPLAQVAEPQAEVTDTTEGQAIAPVQEKAQAESATVEIPDRVESTVFIEEATSTGSIRPMPWDQIQESVLPIPPAQVEEVAAEGTATTEAHSVPIAVDQPQVESATVAHPERADHDPDLAELTAIAPISPMSQGQIQESVIPIPSVPVEEAHGESTATTEERSTPTVSSAGIAEVGHDQSLIAEAPAPASGERELLSGMVSPSVPVPSELDVPSVQVLHSEPEASRLKISTEVPLTALRSSEAQVQSGEAGSTVPSAFAQTDELAQTLRLRLHDARTVEQESAVPQPSNAQEAEATLTHESQELRERVPSGTDESDPIGVIAETVQEASFSLVEDRRVDRDEGAVIPQDVTTEESVEASSPSQVSSPAVPQWQMPEPVTAPPVEREVISAASEEAVSSSPSAEMVATVQRQDDLHQDDLTLAEPIQQSSASAVQQEEWAKTSESIRFVEEAPEAPPVRAESEPVGVSPAVGMMADDTRFMSSRNVGRDASRDQEVESPSRPKVHSQRHGIGAVIQDFIGSCFSTTRAIVATCVGLLLLSVMAVAMGIGIVGLIWISMEEGPSPAYQSFTTIPQQTLSDVKKNGYFLLAGFDAPDQVDPIQAGYEGKTGADSVGMGRACLGDAQGPSSQQPNASASVSKSWFRSADPVGQFKSHSETVRGWASQQTSALSRYGRWHTLSFEDWGYGQTGSLPCASIVFAHELYLADGFLQAMEEGVERLETDMEAWRIVLGQSRTLSVKTLALQAMNDDIAVASGLLVRSDFDGKYLGRLSKMLRPLDQTELSIRWPMQSELVVASKTYEAQVKAAKASDQSLYAVIAATLSLPKQRRLNDYAEYYEASYKAVGEGHHSTLPKWKNYIRTPAAGLSDYMANPIENIVGLEALPPWDLYHGQVMDTEARLRLASLQAWLRRGPTDGDVLTRLAKAGQKFYDPYTGLPMLVNMKKAALYSVGHDGKDQDADPQFDVVVTIPAVHTPSSQPASKSSAESSKP